MSASLVAVKMEARYHHGDLRNALLGEASRVLEAEGHEALSLRGLAKSLGVSHAAPRHHFANRSALLAELAADGFAGLADAMVLAMQRSPSDRWLTEAGKAYVRFAIGHPQRYLLMFGSGVLDDDAPERLSAESARAFMAHRVAVHEGQPPHPGEHDRMTSGELGAWSMVHGAVMLWLGGQLTFVDSEERFLEIADSVLEAAYSSSLFLRLRYRDSTPARPPTSSSSAET